MDSNSSPESNNTSESTTPEIVNGAATETTGSPQESHLVNQRDIVKANNAYIVRSAEDIEGYDTKLPAYQNSNPSVIASADFVMPEGSNFVDPNNKPIERASTDDRKIWSVNAGKGEKPTEITKDVTKFSDAKSLDKASEKYGRSTDELDSMDQFGRRQNAEGVYGLAERVKLVENVKAFEGDLKKGRALSEKELGHLTDLHMETNEEYNSFKASYESKKLTAEDTKTLLSARFAKEISAYQDGLKGSDGKASSMKLSLDELVTLRDEYKEEKYKAYTQDRASRSQNSEDEARQRAIDEYKKGNPDWNKSVFGAEEQARVLAEENALLREKANATNTSSTTGGAGTVPGTTPEVTPGTTPEVTPGTTPEVTPGATPEKTPVPTESKEAKEKRERRIKIASVIAGVVVGGAIGIAGGLPVAVIGGKICLGLTVVNSVLGKIGAGKYLSLKEQAEKATDPVLKAKLEKKRDGWQKVANITKRLTPFLAGAMIGFGAAGLASGIFMGEHGLVWNPQDPTSPIGGNPLGDGPIGTGGGIETGPSTGEPFDSGLIKDGRLDLPGDVSNGNLATGPIGNLPGGELNPNNFAGGPSDMGVWRLDQYLDANHITKESFEAAGGDIHRAAYALSDPAKSISDVISQFGGESVSNVNASLGR